MEKSKKCPKCAGEMVAGQLGQPQINFYKGKGVRSLWTGLFNSKNSSRIQPFRCEMCSYIEIYSFN
jgi:hypothetical protein